MNTEIAQPVTRSFKIGQSVLAMIVLSVLLGTFLRIFLLPLYPAVALLIFVTLKLRITKSCINLLTLILLIFILSLFNGIYIKYNIASLFYMIPFIVLLFSHPGKYEPETRNLAKIFLGSLAVVAFLNNIIGLIQVFWHPDSDDSFTGIYSEFSVSLNGLSLLNALLFTYYFHIFLSLKKWKYLLYGIFFLMSCILGFYGAGLMVFIAAFILVFFKWNLSSIIKMGLVSTISLAAIYYTIGFLKPDTLEYNMINLRKLASFDVEHGPRKLTAFYNYAISYPKNIKDFLFGSGPGTFNSRSAFIVGSPSYFTGLDIIKSDKQPYYFKHYAYSLWNESNNSKALYMDGFRNQPFSSLLAFLGEYGLIFTLLWGWYYYKYYRFIMIAPDAKPPALYRAYKRLIKFLFCFLALLLVIDNYFEYPEIILLIVVSIKVLHIEMFKMINLERIS